METQPWMKVERISRLVRWRVGRIDTMKPWATVGSYSNYFSEIFKVGIWEWSLAILVGKEDNKPLSINLHLEHSLFLKDRPPIVSFVLCVFSSEPGSYPYISPVYKRKFDVIDFSHECNHQVPFIVNIEFLDLKISNCGDKDCFVWPHEGMKQFLTSRSTLGHIPLADVTINLDDGGVLKAHKEVMSANSPVFRSMFLHDRKEKESTSIINIEDMSPESFVALLSYMYRTLKQEEFWKHRFPLLLAADKYRMRDLLFFCEESLLEDICSSNVLERLEEAWFYQLDKLKKRCYVYLFDLGMVYSVKDELGRFFRYADQELKLEILQEMIKVWNPV